MKAVRSTRGINNPYVRRMVGNVVGRDPLKVLAETPVRVRRAVAGMTPRQLAVPHAEGKWAARRILAHLVDAEITFSFRLRMAIAESGKRLQAIDQDKWSAVLHAGPLSIRDELALFGALRKYNLLMLHSLPARAWKRFGMHEERGKETVERMVELYAGHDINHLRQIEAVSSMKKASGRRER